LIHSPCVKAQAVDVIRRKMRLDSEYMLITAGVTCNWEKGIYIRPGYSSSARGIDLNPAGASYAWAIVTGMNMYDRMGRNQVVGIRQRR
jgi:hypothetical protein